jgi:hypothetical protein
MKTAALAILAGTLAFTAIPASAQISQSGDKAYCLQKGTSGSRECAYDTLAQCKQAMTGATDSCNMRAPQTQGQGGGATNPPAQTPKR